MSNVSDISPGVLRSILRYEPETGKLFWRERCPEMFSDEGRGALANSRTWNKRNAGREAFVSTQTTGYKQGRIFNVGYLAHRVIWAIVYGEWPDHEVDHINGVRDDNRLSNLRAVERSANMKNQKRSTKNTSGCTGVSRHSTSPKWVAQIQSQGRNHYLGIFDAKFDAVLARLTAERAFGFHQNHGRVVA